MTSAEKESSFRGCFKLFPFDERLQDISYYNKVDW